MSGVQYCKWERKNATVADGYLGTVEKWFGLDEAGLAAKFGRFVRGKRKDAPRGFLVWIKCIEGGWSHKLGGVVRPGIIYAQLLATYEEMCRVFTLQTDEFCVGAVRVDTCYGFDPVAARHARELLELVYNATANWPICAAWTAEQDVALDKWVALVVPDDHHAKYPWLREQVKGHLKHHAIQREMDAYEIEQLTRLGSTAAICEAAKGVVGAKDA